MNQEVEFSREELKHAIRHDCVVILAFYLGEELTMEVPDFHQEIWAELLEQLEKVSHPDFVVGHLQKLFAVPREHSKSTLAKIAVILFMRYSPLAFTLYVSKTNTVAMQALKDVAAWFESPQEAELYGKPTIFKKNETDSIWVLGICLDNGKQKRITLKALGAGQQVRGTLIDNKRPELVILDDIEDLDTADGGIQQKKLDEWVMGSLLKATARRSIRIFLGNMVRSTTLLARLSRDPEWNPTVFGALVRDKVTGGLRALWEGRWTVDGLLADYRRYRRIGLGHIWETEMMNLNQDTLMMKDLSTAIMIDSVNPEQVIGGFICLDPAFGQKTWHDEAAITVHVRIKGVGIPIIVDHRLGRWNEEGILNQMLELSYYWGLTTWAMEAVAAQKLLIPLFRLLLKDRLIPPEYFSMIPVNVGGLNKGSRILAFRELVASGSYALAESQVDIRLKLEEYTPDSKVHDDLCDSSAYGPVVWELHGENIEARGVTNVVGNIMQPLGMVTESTLNTGEVNVCQF